MISKSVIVFWSVTCLTIAMHLLSKDAHGTLIYILGNGLVWAIVVIPTALIGQLFKSQKVYSTEMRAVRGGVLVVIGLMAFVLTNASQQKQTTAKSLPSISTGSGRGFQPWVER